jgi:hypothetical protein
MLIKNGKTLGLHTKIENNFDPALFVVLYYQYI